MISSEGFVIDAIYAVLRNDPGMIASFPYADGKAAVFDDNNVPIGLTPPYLVIGETVMTRMDVFGKKGQNVLVTLHGWSEYKGKEEIENMRDLVFNALDDGQASSPTLTLSGGVYRAISCLFDNGQIIADDTTNILKWHSTDRYRIFTEAI